MTHSRPVHCTQDHGRTGSSLAENLAGAVRFWERGRIGYNMALVAVTLAWILLTWPHFRPAFTLHSGVLLLALAALANACYCAAYPIDVALQHVSLWGGLMRWRWILWGAGVGLAMLLACYWIGDEVYPFVGRG